MTRCLSRKAMATAYSATAVLPAEVWAETRTDSFLSRQATDTLWNGSSSKGYVLAISPVYLGFERVPWTASSLVGV